MILDYKILNLNGKETIIRAKAKPPYQVVEHLENEACFYFVLTGETRVITKEKSLNILEREGILMQCGDYIGKFLGKADVDEVELIIVKLNKEVLASIFKDEIENLFSQKDRIPYGASKISNSSALEKYVESLIFYIEHPEHARPDILQLKIKELILLLTQTSSKAQLKQLIQQLFTKQDFSFKQIIDANIFSKCTIEELATLCNMSLSSFKRHFKKSYNASPGHYFLKKRLERAAFLLKNSELSISEIAFECAFSEATNFSNSFKKIYGFNPTEFRES